MVSKPSTTRSGLMILDISFVPAEAATLGIVDRSEPMSTLR